MDRVKEFFNITGHYIFDYNDIRCILTIFNVTMIITFGLSVAWIGLSIAIFGTIRDMVITDRKLNSTIIHLTNIILYSYLLTIF